METIAEYISQKDEIAKLKIDVHKLQKSISNAEYRKAHDVCQHEIRRANTAKIAFALGQGRSNKFIMLDLTVSDHTIIDIKKMINQHGEIR